MDLSILDGYLKQQPYMGFNGPADIFRMAVNQKKKLLKRKRERKTLTRKRKLSSINVPKDKAIDLINLPASDNDSDCEIIEHPIKKESPRKRRKISRKSKDEEIKKPNGTIIKSKKELPTPEQIKKYKYEHPHYFKLMSPTSKKLTINGISGTFKVIGYRLKQNKQWEDWYKCSDCSHDGGYGNIYTHAKTRHNKYKKG